MTTAPDPSSLEDFDRLWDYSNPQESERRFRELLPQIEALGDAGLRGQLLTQIARAQGLQRKFAEADALLDQVEQELDSLPPVVRVRSLLERGRVRNSSGDQEQSIPLFQEAWNLARSIGADGFAVDAAHMLGIVASKAERFRWNEKALELAEQSAQPQAQKWKGSVCNNLGWAYHDQADYPRALELFEKALAFRETQGDLELVRMARWCVARSLRSLDRCAEALAMQQALAQEDETLQKPDGYVFEELAELSVIQGDQSQAAHYARQAHELLAADDWFREAEPERLARLQELGGLDA